MTPCIACIPAPAACKVRRRCEPPGKRFSPLVRVCEAHLHCAFALSGSVHALLDAHAATKLDESFDEHGLLLHLQLPVDAFDTLGERLRDVSRGAARLRRVETE